MSKLYLYQAGLDHVVRKDKRINDNDGVELTEISKLQFLYAADTNDTIGNRNILRLAQMGAFYRPKKMPYWILMLYIREGRVVARTVAWTPGIEEDYTDVSELGAIQNMAEIAVYIKSYFQYCGEERASK